MRVLRRPAGFFAMTPSAARTAIGLAALTFIFYLLWSKGFSPQWVLYLIAFLCILLPNFLGTVLIALLEALYVIEWPHHVHPAQRRCALPHGARDRAHGIYRRVGVVLRSGDLHRRCFAALGNSQALGQGRQHRRGVVC